MNSCLSLVEILHIFVQKLFMWPGVCPMVAMRQPLVLYIRHVNITPVSFNCTSNVLSNVIYYQISLFFIPRCYHLMTTCVWSSPALTLTSVLWSRSLEIHQGLLALIRCCSDQYTRLTSSCVPVQKVSLVRLARFWLNFLNPYLPDVIAMSLWYFMIT